MSVVTEIAFPHASGVGVRTLPEGFTHTARMRPDAIALRTPGGPVEITWAEYARRVERIAAGLSALGVRRGEPVALMLGNRPEFHLVDTALLHLGAIPFSIYNTSAPEQIDYLFTDAGNSVVITEQAFLAAIEGAGTALDHVVSVDSGGTITLAEVEDTDRGDFDLQAAADAVQPSDIATLIYTSGTTGPPKGVEITHANIVAELSALAEHLTIGFDDRIISYLPAAHIADRVSAHAASLVRGIQITSVSDPREIAAALAEVHPSVFFGVPRVWQKIKAGIEGKLEAETNPVKSKLAAWALGVGSAAARADLAGTTRGRILETQYMIADKLILSAVRGALGLDNIKLAASGAASIPAEVLEFFAGLGIPVVEVWGMSETTAVSTMTTADDLRIGTVGKPLTGVEIKLADDGELLVRGPMVMRGYRNQPEKTADTIDSDGWLASGDIATVDADGNYKIVDRKKELLINESGKNLSPTNIENALKASSSLISQVVALGDGKPYVSALVVLDPDVAAARAGALGLDAADLAALAEHPDIREEVRSAVTTGNGKLSRVEQIKRFVILPHAWEPGGDELTPTMKLRRTPISTKYAELIVDLYATDPGGAVIDLR
ncbi:AMP-dependent synthetase/ligase [Gordonia rubripertincta]|uniref:Acyl-CoA synthetase n=1 Tax=Gordonia rubripertincta TaxID=36822 RepID=A0ABT4MQC3_GORRU|nr:long-chain fatty acid--CoA ligase [Gordonia rubripertincta]MCZ4549178.1 long-chain fatty acid--CoA ligase [Gordonia rubripertincta]